MRIEEVKSIGILGAGIMGTGIAQTAILAGYEVILRDLKEEILARSKETIINGKYGLKSVMERGKLTLEQMENALARLRLTTNINEIKDCDVIIEAVGGSGPGEIENKPLKLKVFAELDTLVKKEAVFASNTGRFTIADIAAATQRKDKFIGMHWYSPAFIMKAIEVVWTDNNSEETINLIENLGQKLGKNCIRVKDSLGDRGHVGLRVFMAAEKEALAIVQEGLASSEGINAIMTDGFKWPAGPLAMKQEINKS